MKRDITSLIDSQRLTPEYKGVSTRIKKIYVLDSKIEIVKDIVSWDKESGIIVIQAYVTLINKHNSDNIFFFDEFLANVCLAVFRLEEKSGDYKKDIKTSCELVIKSLEDVSC